MSIAAQSCLIRLRKVARAERNGVRSSRVGTPEVLRFITQIELCACHSRRRGRRRQQNRCWCSVESEASDDDGGGGGGGGDNEFLEFSRADRFQPHGADKLGFETSLGSARLGSAQLSSARPTVHCRLNA